jgi:hypothetical protein
MARYDLDTELAALADLPPAQLREKWVAVTSKPLPRISPGLLRLALAWETQAAAHGGLSRRTSQKLDQLAAAKTTTRDAKPGMRLVREWNGKVHVVVIGEDGVIRWNAREWKSLSEVARTITGTRWSGPAFFGLKRRTAA